MQAKVFINGSLVSLKHDTNTTHFGRGTTELETESGADVIVRRGGYAVEIFDNAVSITKDGVAGGKHVDFEKDVAPTLKG